MGAGAGPRRPGEARSSESETLDTSRSDWDAGAGLSIEILVHNGQVFEEPEYYEDERPEAVAKELRDLTQAERVRVSHIDPTLGAGTNGLAFLLQFLQIGAAVITWAFAVKAISPRIREAIAHLRSLSPQGAHPVTISLSAEGLQVLVAAEVCARHDVDPSDIRRLDCVSHETELSESRRELEQLYSAHTITVEAVGEDDYHHVWVYTVSPRGRVLAESKVRVPMPNGTQWGWPEPTPGRRLETF